MTNSLNVTHVVEGIISSYEEKLQSISLIIDNTQIVLGEFQESMSHAKEEKEALNVRLRDTLARNESLRKKDFDVMMNTILVSQNNSEKEVKKLLHNYLDRAERNGKTAQRKPGNIQDHLNNGSSRQN